MSSSFRYRANSLMYQWTVFTLCCLTLGCYPAFSQLDDCSLDIGGADTELLIEAFQLNEDQQARLEIWRAELSVQMKVIEDDMSQLLENHPQSTQADLQNLSKKYGKLKNQLTALTLEYDQKLLGVFNEKQYAFYVELCNEALRIPLAPGEMEEEEEEQKN